MKVVDLHQRFRDFAQPTHRDPVNQDVAENSRQNLGVRLQGVRCRLVQVHEMRPTHTRNSDIPSDEQSATRRVVKHQIREI